MNKLHQKITAIAAVACFAAELAFSDALSLLFKLSGKTAPLCVLLGGGLAVALMFAANKLRSKAAAFAIASIYAVTVMLRLAQNTAYLYNGKLTLAVLAAAVVLAMISGIKGIRGAGIFGAICFIPLLAVFAVCCVFGGVDVNFAFFNGIIKGNILSGTLLSFSLLSPFALCALFTEKSSIRACAATGTVSTAMIVLMLAIAVGVFGVTASDYPSVIAEMSKNVSFGKFFQRLEGFADASYIVAAAAAITFLGAMIGETVELRSFKYSRAVAVGLVFILSAALAYTSVKVDFVKASLLLLTSYASVAVTAIIFVIFLGKRRLTALTCAVLMLMLSGCAAKREIETQTFVVITAFDGDKIHLITENANGGNMYSAETTDLALAVKAVEQSKSVSISLLQAELLLIGGGANIRSSMAQALASDMPNSAAVMLMEGDIGKMYESISANYESVFDYVASLQSNAERSGIVCEPASAIKAEYEETGKTSIGLMDEMGIKGNIDIKKSAN